MNKLLQTQSRDIKINARHLESMKKEINDLNNEFAIKKQKLEDEQRSLECEKNINKKYKIRYHDNDPGRDPEGSDSSNSEDESNDDDKDDDDDSDNDIMDYRF